MEMTEKELDRLMDYIAELETKNALLTKGLRIAGQYARDNPPAHIPEQFASEYIALATERDADPEGKRYISFWLYLAKHNNLF